MATGYKRQLRAATKLRKRREREIRRRAELNRRNELRRLALVTTYWVEQGRTLTSRPLPRFLPTRRPPQAKNGRWVARADLEVGDVLTGFDGRLGIVCEAPGDPALPIAVRPIEFQEVRRVFRNKPAPLLNVYIGAATAPIRVTHNHPWYVKARGWIASRDLRIGDLLMTPERNWVPVTAIEDRREIEPVYNLEVVGAHTYFVCAPRTDQAVLVHNTSPRMDEKDTPKPPGEDEGNGRRRRNDMLAAMDLEAQRQDANNAPPASAPTAPAAQPTSTAPAPAQAAPATPAGAPQRKLLTLADIQKLYKDSQVLVDQVRKNDPNDARLLFFDTQQTILKKLANGGGPFDTPEKIDWLARVLTRFMGSLNLALQGKIQPGFDPRTGKPAINPATGNPFTDAEMIQGVKDRQAGKLGGAWWAEAFAEVKHRTPLVTAGAGVLDPNAQEAGAVIMATAHIHFDLKMALLHEGPGTDDTWKHIGQVVEEAAKENGRGITNWLNGRMPRLENTAKIDPLLMRNEMRKLVLDYYDHLRKGGKWQSTNPFEGLEGSGQVPF